MTTISTIQCDKCQRVEAKPNTDQWSYIYRYPGGYKDEGKVDLCPTCFALLEQFIVTKP